MGKEIKETIIRAIDDANRYPFLFVGSGISRRYMGTPGWVGLLEKICTDILGNELAFAQLKAQALTAVRNGKTTSELPYVATLMEDRVNEALFSESIFEEFRTSHKNELVAGISPMKLYIADYLSTFTLRENEETALLKKIGHDKVSGIITTNYDVLCETLFPEFSVFIGEEDLLFSEQGYSQEIYKIHGSLTSPDTLVLTSADYSEFEQKRKYLAAKLLTIFVEFPVMFFGYSIQDENVQAILSEIANCLKADHLARLQKRLIFIQHGSIQNVDTHSISFGDKMLTMTQITTSDFSELYSSLYEARKLYSTKFIREMKGSIYRLAEKVDPTSNIMVSGVDSVLDSLDPDSKIVIGIATSPTTVGKPIKPEDIFEDIVLDNLRYDPKFVVENYLNTFVRRFPNNMPVFKYATATGEISGKDVADYAASFSSIDDFRSKTIKSKLAGQRKRFEGSLSVEGLVKICGEAGAARFIPYLSEDEIDVDELGRFLRSKLVQEDGTHHPDRITALKNSDFRKCVRIYDYLRYGKRKSSDLCQ